VPDRKSVEQGKRVIVGGRAVAHEIGHYLLDTHTHASHGLMRAQFDAVEFTDLRDGTFALDRTASEWLKLRLNLSRTSARNAEQNRFAYAR